MPSKIYSNETLDYQDFSGKCLVGVSFINCSIRFCNFMHSDLSYAIFESCDLYNTQFNDAVLYFTRITECDATKAVFTDSFLNGIRIKETVITYTVFGEDFKANKERKSIRIANITDEYLKIMAGDSLPKVLEIESSYKGIYVEDSNIAIQFIDNSADHHRIWRRKSEISLTVKKILEENGYKDSSLHYYYLHRKFLRKSKRSWLLRLWDYVFNHLFWGYGVRILNPVIAFFVVCVVFSIFYAVLPCISNGESGMKMNNNIIDISSLSLGAAVSGYFQILYGSFLISTLSVFGDMDLFGYAKVFAVLHILISVLLIGLGITSLSKKLANA